MGRSEGRPSGGQCIGIVRPSVQFRPREGEGCPSGLRAGSPTINTCHRDGDGAAQAACAPAGQPSILATVTVRDGPPQRPVVAVRALRGGVLSLRSGRSDHLGGCTARSSFWGLGELSLMFGGSVNKACCLASALRSGNSNNPERNGLDNREPSKQCHKTFWAFFRLAPWKLRNT